TPELDARVLIGYALELDHAALAANGERVLSVQEWHIIDALADRRRAREPVARILGVKEFWGLALRLNAETLVPRPETETLVEAALAAAGNHGDADAPLWLADLAPAQARYCWRCYPNFPLPTASART